MLESIKQCPLCGETAASGGGQSPRNLYSEQLSKLLGCTERELLATFGNQECQQCGLWYKTHRLPPSIVARLFGDVLPSHPKGWDVASVKFSPEGFAREVRAYALALRDGNDEETARARRTLMSIVESLVELRNDDLGLKLEAAVLQADIAALDSLQPRLHSLEWRPWPYKRFCGFGDPALWDWFEQVLDTPIVRYGEVGCPLWGFLRRRPKSGGQWFRVLRPEPNYWGDACRVDGMNCGVNLARDGNTNTVSWDSPDCSELDLLGAFQYLDHVEQPMAFLRDALKRSRAIALILDAVDQPTAVQHHTGWGTRPIAFAAQRLGARLNLGFEPIRSSGNDVFVLSRGSTHD